MPDRARLLTTAALLAALALLTAYHAPAWIDEHALSAHEAHTVDARARWLACEQLRAERKACPR